MTAIQLLEWQNLPFVLPFLSAVVYLLLLAFGGAPDHDHDVDADADADMDHGIEHTIGHDHGHEHEGSYAILLDCLNNDIMVIVKSLN